MVRLRAFSIDDFLLPPGILIVKQPQKEKRNMRNTTTTPQQADISMLLNPQDSKINHFDEQRQSETINEQGESPQSSEILSAQNLRLDNSVIQDKMGADLLDDFGYVVTLKCFLLQNKLDERIKLNVNGEIQEIDLSGNLDDIINRYTREDILRIVSFAKSNGLPKSAFDYRTSEYMLPDDFYRRYMMGQRQKSLDSGGVSNRAGFFDFLSNIFNKKSEGDKLKERLDKDPESRISRWKLSNLGSDEDLRIGLNRLVELRRKMELSPGINDIISSYNENKDAANFDLAGKMTGLSSNEKELIDSFGKSLSDLYENISVQNRINSSALDDELKREMEDIRKKYGWIKIDGKMVADLIDKIMEAIRNLAGKRMDRDENDSIGPSM
jgi:hypothetical protein